MDRVRVWLAVAPVGAAGVLVSHALAYRLTGTPGASTHAYLDHAPQVLLVLAVLGVAFAAFTSRHASVCAWAFPTAALAAFAVQEHLERILHTGEIPFLLDRPVFVVGLLLQLPFAVGAWLLARALLGSLAEERSRRPRLPRALLAVVMPRAPDVLPVPIRPLPARGPPPLRRP